MAPVVAQSALTDPARLRAVQALGLEGAEQYPALARLNELAQRLLGVPVSVVSMVTGGRHVSLSQAGLSDDRCSHMELPLSHTLCQHVVESGDVLLVEDAASHPLTAGGLASRDLGLAAYAGVPLALADGSTIGAVCAIDTAPRVWKPEELDVLAGLRDIAAEILDQRRALREHALRDAVTGLPRQPLFLEQAQTLIGAAEPHESVTFCLLDVEGFDDVNARLGHDGGDAVLAEIGLRLERAIRRTRRPGAVMRLTADTFVVAGVTPSAEPEGRLHRDLAAAAATEPVRLGDVSLQLTMRSTSLRTSMGSDAAGTLDELLILPVDGHRVAIPACDRHNGIRAALPGAHLRGELSLHYQPIYGLDDGVVRGLEALLRWNHPTLGAVRPDEFIPVAEQTGAIVPIGEWVLARALDDLRVRRDQRPGSNLRMSVNVAPEQLLAPGFASRVAGELAARELPACALTVEVTERTLGEDQAAVQGTLEQLTAHGVHLSIDDFGTGYSSLSRIASHKIDEVKLDRSFTADLPGDERQRTMVTTIVAMAKGLSACVVAEGIETVEQYHALRDLGCELGQGYLMARPQPHASTELTSYRG